MIHTLKNNPQDKSYWWQSTPTTIDNQLNDDDTKHTRAINEMFRHVLGTTGQITYNTYFRDVTILESTRAPHQQCKYKGCFLFYSIFYFNLYLLISFYFYFFIYLFLYLIYFIGGGGGALDGGRFRN